MKPPNPPRSCCATKGDGLVSGRPHPDASSALRPFLGGSLPIAAVWLMTQSPAGAQTAEQLGLDRGMEGGETLLASFLLTLSLSALGGILVWALAGLFIDHQMERFSFGGKDEAEWSWEKVKKMVGELANTPRWRRVFFAGGFAFLAAILGAVAFALSASPHGVLFGVRSIFAHAWLAVAIPMVVVLACAAVLWKHYSEAKWERHMARMAYAEESKVRGPSQGKDPDRFRRKSGFGLLPVVVTLAVVAAATWRLCLVPEARARLEPAGGDVGSSAIGTPFDDLEISTVCHPGDFRMPSSRLAFQRLDHVAAAHEDQQQDRVRHA